MMNNNPWSMTEWGPGATERYEQLLALSRRGNPMNENPYTEEDLLDSLLLLAVNNGDAYRDGKNAKRAVEEAYREFQQYEQIDLRETYSLIRAQAIDEVHKQWRSTNKQWRSTNPSSVDSLEVYSADELEGYPTLSTGQAENLKVEDEVRGVPTRWWLSRMTAADGETAAVHVEQLIGGRWEEVHAYGRPRRDNPTSDILGNPDFDMLVADLESAVINGELDMLDAEEAIALVENGCPPGELQVRRKAYTRKGYTRADGTRVKRSRVPAATYCAPDRGAPGRGPKVIELKDGGLGGAGYLSKSDSARRKILRSCVSRDGYRTCLGRINALGVLGKREFSQKELATVKKDRKWLVKEFGGPGSFGPRKKRRSKSRRRNPETERRLRVR